MADGPLGAMVCGSPCNKRKRCCEWRLHWFSPSRQAVRMSNELGTGMGEHREGEQESK